MVQYWKKHSAVFGLIFTVAAALFMIVMTFAVYSDAPAAARMQEFLFDCGVDVICSMIAAGLYYGCMKQEGEGTGEFRALNVFVSAGFVVNFLLYYTTGVPEQRNAAYPEEHRYHGGNDRVNAQNVRRSQGLPPDENRQCRHQEADRCAAG